MLLSYANPIKNGHPEVELWDLNKQKKLHTYKIDIKKIAKKLGIKNKYDFERYRHPLLLDDGSLLLIGEGGEKGSIIKLNQCGKFLKSIKNIHAHHSLEIDKKGRIYTPIYHKKIIEDADRHPENFRSDGIAVLDNDLNVIKKYSLLEIYKKNKLLSDIYGNQDLITDPFHLNDVQPVYFPSNSEKEIVLLSMKGHSRVMALDLKEKKVLWFIDRATLLQHDVDVISMNKNNSLNISIFNNNTRMYGNEYQGYKNFGNNIIYFSNLPMDKSDSISIGDEFNFKKYSIKKEKFNFLSNGTKPKTRNEGLAEHILENDSLMIEETNFGRLIEVDLKDKTILWQYYNKVDKLPPFMMNWSRRFYQLPQKIKFKNI